MFQFRRQLVSVFKSSKRTEESSASLLVQQLVPAEGPDGAVHGGVQRELPDVTGFLVVVLVTLAFGAIGFADDYIKVAKRRNLGLTARAKMGLQMKRRFWEEDDKIFGGHLYSNLPLGEFSYPSNDYFSQKGVLLGVYSNGGPPVAELFDKPVKERVEHVLMHASKVHPQIRQEFESAYAVWWRKVKYSQGGYASGGAVARRAQLQKVDNRIVIGSAATAPYSQPDWQEGAVAAGWLALKSVHERAMRS